MTSLQGHITLTSESIAVSEITSNLPTTHYEYTNLGRERSVQYAVGENSMYWSRAAPDFEPVR